MGEPSNDTAPPGAQERLERQTLIDMAMALAGRGPNDLPASLQTRDLDWLALIKLADQNRMLILLIKGMRAYFPDIFNSKELAPVRDYAARTLAQNERSLQIYADVLSHLKDHGIDPISFKGPFLAQAAYGDATLREFRDLDLLVRPEDFKPAMALLEQAGLRAIEDNPTECTLSIPREDFHLTIDLHRRLMSQYMIEPSGTLACWDRTRTLTIADRPFETFAQEDLALATALYLVKELHNGPASLGYGLDFTMLLVSLPEDRWPALLQRANAQGVASSVKLAFHFAFGLLRRDTTSLWSDPKDQRLAALAHELYAEFDSSERKRDGAFSFYSRRALAVRRATSASLSAWIRRELRAAWLHLFFTSLKDRRWVRLPRGLTWLHALLRPLRLIIEHLQALRAIVR